MGGRAHSKIQQKNSPKGKPAGLRIWPYALCVTRIVHPRAIGHIGRVTEVKSLTNKLHSPMRNAGVERRQLHSMFFGQFGKVQISELSA